MKAVLILLIVVLSLGKIYGQTPQSQPKVDLSKVDMTLRQNTRDKQMIMRNNMHKTQMMQRRMMIRKQHQIIMRKRMLQIQRRRIMQLQRARRNRIKQRIIRQQRMRNR